MQETNGEACADRSRSDSSPRCGCGSSRKPAVAPHASAGQGYLTGEAAYEPGAGSESANGGQGYPGPASPEPSAEEPRTGPPPGPACTISSRATAPAPDGTPDTRTTIGVCETIEFDAGGDAVDWSANTGWPRADAGKVKLLWAAPDVGGTATITATHPGTGQTCTRTMTVAAPTKLEYKKRSNLTIPSHHIGAGMKLEGTVLPLKVNFGWIAFKEDDVRPSRVGGYFRWLRRHHKIPLRHTANPKFLGLDWDNRFCCDHAKMSGPFPSPFRRGSLQWTIPNRYRCDWSSGAGHVFYHTTQTFWIDASGAVTITKESETAP